MAKRRVAKDIRNRMKEAEIEGIVGQKVVDIMRVHVYRNMDDEKPTHIFNGIKKFAISQNGKFVMFDTDVLEAEDHEEIVSILLNSEDIGKVEIITQLKTLTREDAEKIVDERMKRENPLRVAPSTIDTA